MLLGQLVVIDAVDDGEVGAVGGGGDDARAWRRRSRCAGRLVARGEDARAFERDVDAEILVRQFRRVPDRRDLDLAAADVDRVAVDRHFMGETAMHAVEAQQMGVGLDRAEIVDGDDLDVLASGFEDGAQNIASDASETVDRNSHRHVDAS